MKGKLSVKCIKYYRLSLKSLLREYRRTGYPGDCA